MSDFFVRWLLLLLVLVLLSLGAYVAFKPESAAHGLKTGERLRVGATIYPLADWLREIAGPDADVHLFCAGVANPHHFDPSPRDAMEVSRAHAIFSVGLGLDEWAHKLVKNSGRLNLPLYETGYWISARKLNSDELVPPLKAGALKATNQKEHNHSHEHPKHAHGDEDPHYWLDPERAITVVRSMSEELGKIDVANRENYSRRAEAYIEKLTKLKNEVAAAKSAQARKLVTLHDAYGYLFDRLNIEVAAVVQVCPGVEPATRDFSEALNAMKSIGQTIVFTEPAGNPQLAKMMAADLGVGTALLDPLDIETSEAGKNYIERMTHNLRTLSSIPPAGKRAP